MIRHAGRAAALFAIGALFAGGAWAQGDSLAQSVANPYVVAEELMGPSGGTIKLSSAPRIMTEGSAMQPAVVLTVPTDKMIPIGNTAEIEFELRGATFATDVGSGLLQDILNNAPAGQITAEVIAGGAIDDDSVTFMVEAVAEVASGTQITFWVPNLAVMPTNIGMMGDASVMGVSIVAFVVEKRAVSSGADGIPFPMVSGAVDTPMVDDMTPAVNNLMNRQVVALEDVVGISMADGVMVTVDLDSRKMIADGEGVVPYMAPMAEGSTNALKVGTLTISVPDGHEMSMAYTLDPGKKAFYSTSDGAEMLDESLMGDVSVMVKGDFQTDNMDLVVYGPPGGPYEVAEKMDGVASVNIAISHTGTMQDFLYVPGGAQDLRPSMFTALAMSPFDSDLPPDMDDMGKGSIDYTGLGVQAYAQGVVSANATDGSSFLRVRCNDESNDCSVFLDCRDEMGTAYPFVEAPMVLRRTTAVWSSQAIADVLNPGWQEGLGACDLYSNRELEVQHMVRSGHTLVNNSKVVGRGGVDNSDELTEIMETVAEICDSIMGHVGREASNPDGIVGNSDDVSGITPTPCRSIVGSSQYNNIYSPAAVREVDLNGAEPGL